MIRFNIPTVLGNELAYVEQAIKQRHLSGDGTFTARCNQWFEANFKVNRALLTTSCTHAIEMAAILLDIEPDDEVILPSYTFVSTANAFVLRGARPVFVDIRPDTMNIDETKIEQAITKRTKAIVVVHYAGVACEMNKILEISRKYNIAVVEDAAQGVMSKYEDKYLGAIGHIGCYSFHETKNYQCGEGGAILLNDPKFVERAEIIREKGTNRSKFFRGQVDKYSWVDIGSSYLPSEINAAFLLAQLEKADLVLERRLQIWSLYHQNLKHLEQTGLLTLPTIPGNCKHNAHMFYVKLRDLHERTLFLDHLKSCGIMCTFHYVPLHSSPIGAKMGRFCGEDQYTTKESDRLVRLPLYYALSNGAVREIIDVIGSFFAKIKTAS